MRPRPLPRLRFRAALALSLLAATVPAAAFASGGGSPTRGRLQAFLLTSAPDSLVDLEAHARSVSVVYPTYFDCQTTNGRITGRGVPAIAAYANARHIAVMPRFNCQDGPTVHRILTDPSLRAATLVRLEAIASAPLLRGVCLDLENDGAVDRGALSSFVAELASHLHAHHRRLAVVVDGVSHEDAAISTGFYDDRALSSAADTVFVLGWGTHWAGSAPGPIASLSYVQAVAHYVSSLPNASRFVLGAPMYGLDWPEQGGTSGRATAYQYAGVLALQRAVGATPSRDRASGELSFRYTTPAGVPHQVWYLDARAVAALLRAGRADGLAVGLWRLGQEDQRLWSSSTVTG